MYGPEPAPEPFLRPEPPSPLETLRAELDEAGERAEADELGLDWTRISWNILLWWRLLPSHEVVNCLHERGLRTQGSPLIRGLRMMAYRPPALPVTAAQRNYLRSLEHDTGLVARPQAYLDRDRMSREIQILLDHRQLQWDMRNAADRRRREELRAQATPQWRIDLERHLPPPPGAGSL